MNHLCIGRKYGKYGCGRLSFPTDKFSSAKGSRCLVAKMAELLSFGDLPFTFGVHGCFLSIRPNQNASVAQ